MTSVVSPSSTHSLTHSISHSFRFPLTSLCCKPNQTSYGASGWRGPTKECAAVLDHNAVFTAEMAAGDVLLFDLRALHRGGANVSPTQRRAQIYATFVTEW